MSTTYETEALLWSAAQNGYNAPIMLAQSNNSELFVRVDADTNFEVFDFIATFEARTKLFILDSAIVIKSNDLFLLDGSMTSIKLYVCVLPSDLILIKFMTMQLDIDYESAKIYPLVFNGIGQSIKYVLSYIDGVQITKAGELFMLDAFKVIWQPVEAILNYTWYTATESELQSIFHLECKSIWVITSGASVFTTETETIVSMDLAASLFVGISYYTTDKYLNGFAYNPTNMLHAVLSSSTMCLLSATTTPISIAESILHTVLYQYIIIRGEGKLTSLNPSVLAHAKVNIRSEAEAELTAEVVKYVL